MPGFRRGAPEVRRGAPEVRDGAPEVRDGAPEVRDGAPEVRDIAPEVRDGAPEFRPIALDVRQIAPGVEGGRGGLMKIRLSPASHFSCAILGITALNWPRRRDIAKTDAKKIKSILFASAFAPWCLRG